MATVVAYHIHADAHLDDVEIDPRGSKEGEVFGNIGSGHSAEGDSEATRLHSQPAVCAVRQSQKSSTISEQEHENTRTVWHESPRQGSDGERGDTPFRCDNKWDSLFEFPFKSQRTDRSLTPLGSAQAEEFDRQVLVEADTEQEHAFQRWHIAPVSCLQEQQLQQKSSSQSQQIHVRLPPHVNSNQRLQHNPTSPAGHDQEQTSEQDHTNSSPQELTPNEGKAVLHGNHLSEGDRAKESYSVKRGFELGQEGIDTGNPSQASGPGMGFCNTNLIMRHPEQFQALHDCNLTRVTNTGHHQPRRGCEDWEKEGFSREEADVNMPDRDKEESAAQGSTSQGSGISYGGVLTPRVYQRSRMSGDGLGQGQGERQFHPYTHESQEAFRNLPADQDTQPLHLASLPHAQSLQCGKETRGPSPMSLDTHHNESTEAGMRSHTPEANRSPKYFPDSHGPFSNVQLPHQQSDNWEMQGAFSHCHLSLMSKDFGSSRLKQCDGVGHPALGMLTDQASECGSTGSQAMAQQLMIQWKRSGQVGSEGDMSAGNSEFKSIPCKVEEHAITPCPPLVLQDVLPLEAARVRFLHLLTDHFVACHLVPISEEPQPGAIGINHGEKKKRKVEDAVAKSVKSSSSIKPTHEGDPRKVLPLIFLANAYETLVAEINDRMCELPSLKGKTMALALEAAGGLYRRMAEKFPKSDASTVFKRREMASVVEARARFPQLIAGRDDKRVRFIVVHGLEIVEQPTTMSLEDSEWFKRITGRQEVVLYPQDYKFFTARPKARRLLLQPALDQHKSSSCEVPSIGTSAACPTGFGGLQLEMPGYGLPSLRPQGQHPTSLLGASKSFGQIESAGDQQGNEEEQRQAVENVDADQTMCHQATLNPDEEPQLTPLLSTARSNFHRVQQQLIRPVPFSQLQAFHVPPLQHATTRELIMNPHHRSQLQLSLAASAEQSPVSLPSTPPRHALQGGHATFAQICSNTPSTPSTPTSKFSPFSLLQTSPSAASAPGMLPSQASQRNIQQQIQPMQAPSQWGFQSPPFPSFPGLASRPLHSGAQVVGASGLRPRVPGPAGPVSSVTALARFCDECGAAYVRETSKFCSECGTKRPGT